MPIGRKISEVRKAKKVSLEELGSMVGMGKSALSDLENDKQKTGPDPELVVRIANALDDETILSAYLTENPVFKSALPKFFPDLDRIVDHPSVIFTRLAKEMAEAQDACKVLADMFTEPDPKSIPGFDELFKNLMEQVVDVQRGIELLQFRLLAQKIMNKETRRGIYQQQDEKCQRKGYYANCPTGTEG